MADYTYTLDFSCIRGGVFRAQFESVIAAVFMSEWNTSMHTTILGLAYRSNNDCITTSQNAFKVVYTAFPHCCILDEERLNFVGLILLG